LSRSGVEKLVADALSASPEQVAELAELVMRKTDGTPYFLLRFLESLSNGGQLSRHPATGKWCWDADEINRLPSTDNVVKLVSANIERLPPDSQRALATAAHLGHSFDLELLSRTAGWEPQLTLRHLAECVRQGQLLPSTSEQSVSFRFVHDRVQQAAYALLPDAETRELHLEIAHQLWGGRTAGELQERIFDVCHHFRHCTDLLGSHEERVLVAELNLAAGQRAKASAAYDLGRQFLATGIDSMSVTEGWERAYVVTRDLHRERAECEYLAGNFAVADEHFDLLLQHTKSELDRVTVHTLKTRLAYHATKYQSALDEALRGLAALGAPWPTRDDDALLAAIAEETAELERLLEGRNIQQLLDLPPMDNPRLEAETDLLQELSLVGMFFTPLIVSLATRRILRLSLQSGNSTASAPAYASYGMMIGSIAGQFEVGFAFAGQRKTGTSAKPRENFLPHRHARQRNRVRAGPR
jgi:predicted ATPase